MAALCVVLAACSGTGGVTTPRNGGTLRVALPAAPMSLNPLVARDDASALAYAPIYPLLYAAQTDLSVGPELASALPAYTQGGTVVTVPLRSDARWSDGTAITASDVVYTVRAEMDRAMPGSGAYDWSMVRAVTAPDAHTVRFTLRAADAPFLADQLVTPVVPAHVFAHIDAAHMATAAASTAPMVSGGPFVFRHQTADSVTYDANTSFMLGRPHADHLVMTVAPGDSVVAAQLGSGDISWAPALAAAAAAQSVISSGVAVSSFPDLSVVLLQFNVRTGAPFAPANVRHALAMSLNHDAIVASATGVSQDYPVWSAVNPASWAAAAPAPIAQDTGGAIRLLSGAHPAGRIVFPARDGQRAAAAALAVQQAQRAGITLTPVPLSDSDFAAALAHGSFDIAVVDVPQQLDPDVSPLVRTAAPLNAGGYSNASLDHLLDEELTATAPAGTPLQQVRKPIFASIQQVLASDLPVYPLWTPRHYMGFSAVLAGVSSAGAQLIAARANSFYDDWYLTS